MEGEVRLPDGTVLVARDDQCVEVRSAPGCHAVDTSEVEVLADSWLLYRDVDHRFRVRKIEPHSAEFRGHRATLAIGDHAQLDAITIRWHGVARVTKTDEPVIELTIRNPSWTEAITETLSKSHPARTFRIPKTHDVVDLHLDAVNEDATEIVLAATRGDPTTRAGFGDALRDGTYVFPDGLRIAYQHTTECEYASTTGCETRHHVLATKGDSEKSFELDAKRPAATVHGRTFRIENEKLVVR